jgi:8-oxo-dGTP diphosphatase
MASQKVVKVVCGIIWKDDKVFIARRKPDKSLGGYWEFPGGKLEKNETPETALIRELNEEFGMNVTISKYLGNNIHVYNSFTIDLLAYECEFQNATFQLIDHDQYMFIGENELLEIRLAPADIPFTEIVKNRNIKRI